MKESLVTVDVLGFSVCADNVEEIVRHCLSGNRRFVVNTLNPHSWVLQREDKRFREALLLSDFLVPDGSGIVWACRFLESTSISKIAGFDLFLETLRQLNAANGSVFLLGSTPNVLRAMAGRIDAEYPRVRVGCYSPPYKDEFDLSDLPVLVDEVERFCPDVLFIGLSAPKQEKLLRDLSAQVGFRMASGVGAVFDFYAGTVKRPHRIFVQLHLEWLVRLLGEPKRLWRRTVVSAPVFVAAVTASKVRRLVSRL